MLRFFGLIGILLVSYDHIAFDGKYVSTAGKIAHLVLMHFGL